MTNPYDNATTRAWMEWRRDCRARRRAQRLTIAATCAALALIVAVAICGA